MAAESNNTDEFRKRYEEWLNKAENLQKILTISKKILKELNIRNIPLPGSEVKDLMERPDDQIPYINNCFMLVFQELQIFIAEKKFYEKLLGNDPARFNVLKRSFINHLIDQKRKDDDYSNIYRNANRVLRESDRFTLYSTSKTYPLSFSMGPENNRPPCLLKDDDLFDIEYPDHMPITYEKVNKGKTLDPLAEYFWKKVSEVIGDTSVKIRLNDFIRWIGLSVLINKPDTRKDFQPKKTEDEMGFDDKDINIEEILEYKGVSIEQRLEEQEEQKRIQTWAENFVNQLKDRDKKVFYYRRCKGMTHEEVMIQLKTKSNKAYLIQKVEDQLRDFLRPLPGLSPEVGKYFDKNAGIMFMRKLCENLKKSISDME